MNPKWCQHLLKINAKLIPRPCRKRYKLFTLRASCHGYRRPGKGCLLKGWLVERLVCWWVCWLKGWSDATVNQQISTQLLWIYQQSSPDRFPRHHKLIRQATRSRKFNEVASEEHRLWSLAGFWNQQSPQDFAKWLSNGAQIYNRSQNNSNK